MLDWLCNRDGVVVATPVLDSCQVVAKSLAGELQEAVARHQVTSGYQGEPDVAMLDLADVQMQGCTLVYQRKEAVQRVVLKVVQVLVAR